MRTYDLVIFDMDGTLIDTRGMHDVLFERFWEQYFPDWTLGEMTSGGGLTLQSVFMNMGIGKDQMGEIFEKLEQFYKNDADDVIGKVQLTDGALQMLREMKQGGVITALITNSMWPLVEKLVVASGAAALFDEVMGAGVNTVDKAERFRILREKYQVPAERILYVGDSELDAEAAQEQGVDCCILYTPIGWVSAIGELMERFHPAYVVDGAARVSNIVL